jgi:hypothetical protein
MHPAIRSIASVMLGLVAGSSVNMGLVVAGHMIVPPPPGFDASSMEALAATAHLLGPQHFVFPFLAHAVGTLVGGALAAALSDGTRLRPAIIVGVFFLLGGGMNVAAIPAPMWFNVVDMVLAYLPMAWLGWWLAGRVGRKKRRSVDRRVLN